MTSALQIRTCSDAVVQPAAAGGFASSGVFVDGQLLKHTPLAPGCRPDRLPPMTPVAEETADALFLGCFYNCWGHCITDSLRFLWVFLPQHAARLGLPLDSLKLVYVTAGSDGDRELGASFCELLSLLGIRRERLCEVTVPTRFRRLHVPDPCFFAREDLTRERTPEYGELIEWLIACACPNPPAPSRTVYLTRKRWNRGVRRRDFGERTIERAIGKALPECEVVAPETMTFAEQVRLLSSCRRLIATEGSLAHNAVFLPKGGELVLLRKGEFVNRYQHVITALRNLRVTSLRAYWRNHLIEGERNPVLGPFFLCVTREVAAWLGCRPRFSVWERLLYDALALYRTVRRRMKGIRRGRAST